MKRSLKSNPLLLLLVAVGSVSILLFLHYPVGVRDLNVDILSKAEYIDSLGCYHIVGEVVNTGTESVGSIKMIAIFYNSSNSVVATRLDYTLLGTLLPGRKSPFEIALLDAEKSSEVAKYQLDLTPTQKNALPIGLEIVSHNLTLDEINRIHLSGTIRNVGAQTARGVRLVATYYGKSGLVVAATSTDLDPELPSRIEPNETRSFGMILDEDRSAFVSHCELTAESLEYCAKKD